VTVLVYIFLLEYASHMPKDCGQGTSKILADSSLWLCAEMVGKVVCFVPPRNFVYKEHDCDTNIEAGTNFKRLKINHGVLSLT
jgi:hypothetical protein